MPPLVPYRFLLRLAHPCPKIKGIPDVAEDHLFDLPEAARLRVLSQFDGDIDPVVDVRLAWNEAGIAVQAIVAGKSQDPLGDAEKPRMADGLTLWIDTRGDRKAHRASRYCHQFHLLPTGGGSDKDEPTLSQSKINRAQQDAPIADTTAIPFRCHRQKTGYRLEAFLTAAALNGFDPEQHARLGVYYHIRDQELGDRYLSLNMEFPGSDDPSLWDTLDLVS